VVDQCRLLAHICSAKGPDEGAGDDQQRHRRGELRHKEKGAHAGAARGVAVTRLVSLEQRRDVDPRGVECRDHAEDERREHADGRRIKQNARIELDGEPGRFRQRGPDEVDRPSGKEDPNPAAGEREKQALGQQQPHEAGPGGTGRQADRDLLAARHGARQQEVRDIRAADPQDQADHHQRKDDHEEKLNLLLLRHGPAPSLGPRDRGAQRAVRKKGRGLRGERPQFRDNLGGCHILAQPSEHPPPVLGRILPPRSNGSDCRGHPHRDPERWAFGSEAVKGARGDPQNCGRRAVDHNRLSNDGGVARQRSHPELIIEHGFRRGVRVPGRCRVEKPSAGRTNAEYAEISLRNRRDDAPQTDVSKSNVHAQRLPRGNARHRAAVVSHVAKRRKGHAPADLYDPARFRHSAHRLKEDCVDDAENGRIETDACRKGDHRHGREAGLAAVGSQRVSNVARQLAQPPDDSRACDQSILRYEADVVALRPAAAFAALRASRLQPAG
jgi:hypothetical protein